MANVDDWQSVDDWTTPEAAPAPKKSAPATGLLAPITDIPREVYDTTAEALSGVNDNLNPFSAAGAERRARGEAPSFLSTGKGILSAMSAPFAPIQGAARSLIGHPLAAIAPGTSYDEAKHAVDTALMGLAPRRAPSAAPRPAPQPETVGDFNVPLTQGEATGNFGKIRDEHLALRGGMGERAQVVAQERLAEKQAALDAARTDIARDLDPGGRQVLAENPQQAAEIASSAIQAEAANQRAGYKGLYEQFRQEPGEFDAGTFAQIKPSIVKRLGEAREPIILDEASRVVNPNAHRALDFVEGYFKEHPVVTPDQMNRVGKALVSIYQDAKRNPSDRRATQAVMNSFGKHIDDALDAGLFSGSEQAIQTWKDARAAFAKYKRTFGPHGPGDEVGRAMEKILGRYDGQAATPTEVANYLYGASSIGQKGSSVRIAERVRDVLGPGSPEWSGVKQGLWAKLTEATEGRTDWGPQKVSERVFEFLNGDGRPLANKMFDPAERDLMRRYGELLKKMVPPPGAVNYSNTAPVLKRIMDKTGGTISHLLGIGIGYGMGDVTGAIVAPAVTETFRAAGRGLQDRRAAREVARMMPRIETSMVQWQRAQQRALKNNSPPNQAALAAAAANLANAVRPLGVDLQGQAQ